MTDDVIKCMMYIERREYDDDIGRPAPGIYGYAHHAAVGISRRVRLRHQPDAVPVCRGRIDVTDVSGELTTDQSGEMRLIEADITYDAEIMYETAVNGVYIADMYSTEFESAAVSAVMPLRRALPVSVSHITVSGEAEAENGENVIAATAQCSKYRITNDGKSAAVEGEVDVYIIESNGEYGSRTVTVPFRAPLRGAPGEKSQRGLRGAVRGGAPERRRALQRREHRPDLRPGRRRGLHLLPL